MSKHATTRAASGDPNHRTPQGEHSHTRQHARAARARQAHAGRRRLLTLGGVVGLAVAVLAAIFFANNGGSGGGNTAYAYAVADPKPGTAAPALRLSAIDGSTYDLADRRGKTVLLYFQEGIGCQACWDQLRDVEAKFADFRALGIDELVTVTSDPLDLLRQVAADEGLTRPLLSDPDLSVSAAWGGNRYGMMGSAKNGHSFIVVGPDGTIRWRADYGGPPKYTMYVPVDELLADIRAGLNRPEGSDGNAG